MELWILILGAFIGLGLCMRAIFGLNFWVLFGGVFLLMLILPFFAVPQPLEPEIPRTITDTVAIYVTTLRGWLPSMLVGALAGIFTREILRLPKVIYDFVRDLFAT